MQRKYLNRVAPARSKRKVSLSRTSAIVAGISCPLLIVSPAAQAQRADSSLDEVVVSAQKSEQKLADVPVPVSVLNADDLADTGQVRLRDYFSAVPGFNVTPNYVAFQNLTIRGITTGSDIPTVSVAIDDVPFGGSYTLGVPDIDPGDLERVEVLRGPQGTLYGANSLGGLVKYVTKDPTTDAFKGRVQAGMSDVSNGSQQGFFVRGSANIPVSDTFALRASGFTRQDPGYIDNPVYDLQNVNETHGNGGRLTGLWKPNEDLSVKVSALYQRTEADGLNESVAGPGLGEFQQDYLPGLGSDERTIQAYSATVDYQLGSARLTSTSGYNINRDFNTLDYSFGFGGLVNDAFGVTGAPFFFHLSQKKFAQELRLATPLGESFDLLVGAFYTREHEFRPEETRIDAVDPVTLQDLGKYFGFSTQSWFKERAAFVNVTWHLSERVDVQVGGRRNHDELTLGEGIITGPYADALLGGDPNIAPSVSSDADATTYLATASYKLIPDVMTYIRLSSGFRPGNANSVIPGIPRQSNPDKSKNYEIGLKGNFFDRMLAIDASIYHIDWSNFQLQLRDPVSTFPYQSNGSAAKSQGVELSAAMREWRGLKLGGWVSYSIAELTEPFPDNSGTYGVPGDRLPFSSRWSGHLSLEQEFSLGRLHTGFVGGDLSYVGDRVGVFQPTALRQEYPSYALADVQAGIRADSWTASVYVNNVANRQGLLSGGIGYFYAPARIYTTPRTVGLSVIKTF